MENKDLIIIALIVVIIYLAYQNQASSQSPLIVESPITQQLRSELNHYQTLYENRVKKDLGFENKDQETQTEAKVVMTKMDETLPKKNNDEIKPVFSRYRKKKKQIRLLGWSFYLCYSLKK